MNASGSQALALAPDGVIYHGVNNNPASWGGASPDLYNTNGILNHSADGGANCRELPTGAPRGLRSTSVFVNQANSAHLWRLYLDTIRKRAVRGQSRIELRRANHRDRLAPGRSEHHVHVRERRLCVEVRRRWQKLADDL